ncbi:MAG TPA: cyclic nucleotide-binding domain-containing protein [Terriglobales bacterium]|nr:cyclic nucleotide-binding domain-containing protein [Terriglobales bacterium]
MVAKTGKEATIGILTGGDFFGEGSLAGQTLRMGSAAAMTDCSILRIGKKVMMNALHREHGFSDLFVAHLLARNIRYEEKMWWINSLIRARNGSLTSCCCSLASERRAHPRV